MKALYDQISQESARNVTQKYSTSFSSAVRLLAPRIRQDIHNIYGFVRVADEIVDSFHAYPKAKMLDQFEEAYRYAYQHKISINPIVNAFVLTVHKYNIDPKLIEAFLKSMRDDLSLKNYQTKEEIDQYIYGSADVVGLMCLKVFVEGDEKKYLDLKSPAMKLGSAFQKVNFLRDMKDDMELLNRSYFPDVNLNSFSQLQKQEILNEVHHDFEEAFKGISQLPACARNGVYVAYRYYKKLLKQLGKTEPSQIMKKRIRVSNVSKFCVLIDSQLRLKLNMI